MKLGSSLIGDIDISAVQHVSALSILVSAILTVSGIETIV
jgi:hypothetical protein